MSCDRRNSVHLNFDVIVALDESQGDSEGFVKKYSLIRIRSRIQLVQQMIQNWAGGAQNQFVSLKEIFCLKMN